MFRFLIIVASLLIYNVTIFAADTFNSREHIASQIAQKMKNDFVARAEQIASVETLAQSMQPKVDFSFFDTAEEQITKALIESKELQLIDLQIFEMNLSSPLYRTYQSIMLNFLEAQGRQALGEVDEELLSRGQKLLCEALEALPGASKDSKAHRSNLWIVDKLPLNDDAQNLAAILSSHTNHVALESLRCLF